MPTPKKPTPAKKTPAPKKSVRKKTSARVPREKPTPAFAKASAGKPAPSTSTTFPKVNPKQSFPELELEVLKFWQKNKIFETSVERNALHGEFKFFDGPPFATGLPHYGHILQGVIKDLIPRYKTMQGFRVPRVWGWDCHGLPVENLIEKELGLGSKTELEKFGIGKFNEACRASVMTYANEWKKTVARMGRWIDMEHDYKTMSLEYMESVWWVFGKLWKKNLVYEGLKPMQICPRCVTPLANFEVGLGYRDVTDLSATVKFKLIPKLDDNDEQKVTIALVRNEHGKFLVGTKRSGKLSFPGGHVDAGETISDAIRRETREEAGIEIEPEKVFATKYKSSGKSLHTFLAHAISGTPTDTLEMAGWKWWPLEQIKKAHDLHESARLAIMALEEGTDVSANELEKIDPTPTYFLAWTTTPWTLPGNVALAVNPEERYYKLKVDLYETQDGKILFEETPSSLNNKKIGTETYIASWRFFEESIDFKNILEFKNPVDLEIKDSELVGQKYEPLFPYFANLANPNGGIHSADRGINSSVNESDENNERDENFKSGGAPALRSSQSEGGFRIVAGDFVTTEDGTGIVHIAPAFGEDDYRIAKANDLPVIQHVTMEGKFTKDVVEFAGLDVKPKDDPRKTDTKIVEWLEARGKLFKKESFKHSYPFCWRCETPLLNYATSSWFVAVEGLKTKLLANNKKINWVPEHIKHGRFGKWLEGARDWAISRNRYWGAPLPIWKCESCGESVCVSSREELEKLSGKKVNDLHKHIVDELTWECQKCKGTRTEIVFVRHGETDWNVEQKIQGFTDNALNTHGREQAREARARIRADDFDVVISSRMKRAHETAQLLAPDREILIDERVIEKNFGEYEGLTFAEIFAQFPDVKTKHAVRWDGAHGSESRAELLNRVQNFLDEMRKKYAGKKVLVATHTLVIRALKYLLTKDEVYLDEEFPNLYTFTTNTVAGFRRVPEVFDCWFESGAMPYAQHATKEKTKLPANFIAEAQDQTRGWFYTLHVLATALFDKPAYENVVCSGLVLAEDGQKMSKSKKNYPDPAHIFDTYGADAMRLYLMNSPVVNAQELRFSERGVEETLRSVLLPLWNTYYFFTTYANADGWTPTHNSQLTTHSPRFAVGAGNSLDKWILSELNILIEQMTQALERYEINSAVKPLASFLDGLTNWYVRRSRRRFWRATQSREVRRSSSEGEKSESDEDKNEAYETLHHVLVTVARLLAPVCPFIAERIYRDLTNDQRPTTNDSRQINSVHLTAWPKAEKKMIDQKLSMEVEITRKIIELGLAIRGREKIKVRQPLARATIALPPQFTLTGKNEMLATIREELNAKAIEFAKDPNTIAEVIVNVNARAVGPRLGGKVQQIIVAAKRGEFEVTNDGVKILDEILTGEEISVGYRGKEGLVVESADGIVVALDIQLTPELEREGRARDLVRTIQELRKKADYNVSDRIELAVTGADDILADAELKKYVLTETLAEKLSEKIAKPDLEEEIEGVSVSVRKIS